MKPSTLSIVFLVVRLIITTPAWACDSYEDCMKQVSTVEYDCHESPFGKCYHNVPSDNNLLQAIAYKLDEISKKMDKPEPTYIKTTPCVENEGKYYILGTTIEISKQSCSKIVNFQQESGIKNER